MRPKVNERTEATHCSLANPNSLYPVLNSDQVVERIAFRRFRRRRGRGRRRGSDGLGSLALSFVPISGYSEGQEDRCRYEAYEQDGNH